MGLCVLPGYRGEGVGAKLLEAIIHEARRRSLAEISLSVEDGNPSRRLYERFGFRPMESALNVGTMVLELTSAPRADEPSR